MRLLTFPSISFEILHFPELRGFSLFGITILPGRDSFNLPGKRVISSFQAILDHHDELKLFEKKDFEYGRYKFYGAFISGYPEIGNDLMVELRVDHFEVM